MWGDRSIFYFYVFEEERGANKNYYNLDAIPPKIRRLLYEDGVGRVGET